MPLEDYFSPQAERYMRFRPAYPPALFGHISAVALERSRAWDCGTGSGQAARGLADFFETVIATDASEHQVSQAPADSRIEYAVATAEETPIVSQSIDLVTVAQALHWLDLERFYDEVRRVLKPAGVIAVWSYNTLIVSGEVGSAIRRYYTNIVGEFWPPQRRLVEEGYRSLPFPFDELACPRFDMTVSWDLERMAGYLGTWSSAQRYQEQYGTDPVAVIWDDLRDAWASPKTKKIVRWPLTVRIGRV